MWTATSCLYSADFRRNGRRNHARGSTTSQSGKGDNRREPRARKFFDQWRAALRWQRLKPFEKFAALSPLEDLDLPAAAATTDPDALEFTHTNPRRALQCYRDFIVSFAPRESHQ